MAADGGAGPEAGAELPERPVRGGHQGVVVLDRRDDDDPHGVGGSLGLEVADDSVAALKPHTRVRQLVGEHGVGEGLCHELQGNLAGIAALRGPAEQSQRPAVAGGPFRCHPVGIGVHLVVSAGWGIGHRELPVCCDESWVDRHGQPGRRSRAVWRAPVERWRLHPVVDDGHHHQCRHQTGHPQPKNDEIQRVPDPPTDEHPRPALWLGHRATDRARRMAFTKLLTSGVPSPVTMSKPESLLVLTALSPSGMW